MSDNASPLQWTGNKGCIYTTIDAFMPPHKTYIEPCMGSAEIFLRKKPTEREILNDYNGDLVKFFRVLQSSQKVIVRNARSVQCFVRIASIVSLMIKEA